MASKAFKGVVGACIAGSMLFSSTAAMASAPARVQQVSPWAALSVLSGGAPAAAICGSTAAAAVAAAQSPGGCVLPVVDAPPPLPPSAAAAPLPAGGVTINPLLAALPLLVGAAAIYFVLHGHNFASNPTSTPNSAG